jgi:hypothetical protein
MHIKIKDYNVKFKNSLKGYFKTRSKGFSHEESLKFTSNNKIKRKIDYKIKKEINKNGFVIEKQTLFITIICFVISLILVSSILVNKI